MKTIDVEATDAAIETARDLVAMRFENARCVEERNGASVALNVVADLLKRSRTNETK